MNISEINEEIKIEDFLISEGYNPKLQKKGGLELWYCSPLHAERTPSFKVHTGKNVWFDYALGRGGKLIELYKQLKNENDINNIVYFFNNEYKGGVYQAPKEFLEKKETEKESPDEILEEIFPVKNVKLWDYLRGRKIDFDIAREYLTEVHYKSNGKNWYALGFKCDNAGYELRNPFSKRNINGKNITTIKNGSNKVKLFEGMFDFLSYASEHKSTYKDYDYIVLNTSAFVQGMYNNIHKKEEDYLYNHLIKYERIDTYFDNDDTGVKITHLMEKIFSGVNNFSVLFEKYKDYNEYCTEGKIDGVFTEEEVIEVQNTIVREEIEEENKVEINLGMWSHFS